MKSKKTVLVGIAILLVAVAIVLTAVLVPMASNKKGLKKILNAVADAERISLGDPDFETGDLLGNKGKEILLEGETLAEVKAQIAALQSSGYRQSGEEKRIAGSFDLHLKIRSAEGTVYYLWLAESGFYYGNGDRAIWYKAEDEGAYAAFYGQLTTLLQEN